MARFKMVKQPTGVWDIVTAKDGPWMMAEDHEKAIAEQRQEIARLREALGKLHSLQNGCPLPKYEADYLYCMVQVEHLLGLDKEDNL